MSCRPFSIHDIYGQIFKIWRRKRFSLFVRELSPSADCRLLDIGGYPEFWTAHPVLFGEIVTLNVYPISWNASACPDYHIRAVVGDGCNLHFPDGSFDIAFSNSVIEHVGSWDRQQAFAREVRRVGKNIWVQTPAFECPIEPHYLAPFIHWTPKPFRRKTARWITPWGLIQKPSASEVNDMVETTRLLTRREMRILFPDCRIHTEYALGFIPKSYVAIKKNRL